MIPGTTGPLIVRFALVSYHSDQSGFTMIWRRQQAPDANSIVGSALTSADSDVPAAQNGAGSAWPVRAAACTRTASATAARCPAVIRCRCWKRRENGAMRVARDAYGPTPGPASRRGSRPLMAGRSLNGQGMTG